MVMAAIAAPRRRQNRAEGFSSQSTGSARDTAAVFKSGPASVCRAIRPRCAFPARKSLPPELNLWSRPRVKGVDDEQRSGTMCDYSLMHVKSRPASVGDKLRTRNFGTGTRGFAACDDPTTAVCVLPGTELAFNSEICVYGSSGPTAHKT